MAEWYPKRTFGSLVDEKAERFGEREALVFGEQRYTFKQVRERVDEVAAGLIKLGVRHGDHVALWLVNRPEWIFCMFALARIGAVQVPVNTRFRTHDLEYLLRQSDARYLIAHDVSGPIRYLDMIREVVALPEEGHAIDSPEFPELRKIIILGDEDHTGCVDFGDMLDGAGAVDRETVRARADAVDPDDPAFIMYTSGTTGFPKGVVHNHIVVRLVEERAFRMAVTENDVILNYLPLFHLFSFSEIAVMSMVTGAGQVLVETFDPDACIQLVEREGITIMHGFETHFGELIKAQERHRCDVSTLRTGLFLCGMQTSGPVCRKAAEVLAPIVTVTAFGMTETIAGVTIGSLGDSLEQRSESSGYPLPGYEYRIVNPETNEELPVGEPGEIVVRGYGLMLGYYRKPEETAGCYDDEGWFHTGDCGLRREDGHVRFFGRFKDMLKVGGENVDPMEVENLLLEVDGVQQVAVVSFPDERLTEVPVAYVRPGDGATLEEQDVIDYCKGKLASFKIPHHVLFLDEIPMTSSGKIRKFELREDALEKLTPH